MTAISVVTAATVKIAGAFIFNEAGAVVDFRLESDGYSYIFFIDASANVIGINTSTPDGDAIMDIGSAGKPIILPKLTTTERGNVTAAEGMLIYNETDQTLDYYDGASWLQLTGT